MKKLFGFLMCALCAVGVQANDHVMAATRPMPVHETPAVLTLTVDDAQAYAVEHNRSLRNAELAVQQAYAARWQTIASMLPQVDASGTYTNYCGYSMTMSMGGQSIPINMPNVASLGIQSSVGINGQAVTGAVMNTIAIRMKKIALEQNEVELRASVRNSYASLLVMQDVVRLLENSYANLENLYQMTLRTVEVGAAEQTQADLIRVRVNTLKDNIASNKRNIALAEAVLKVLLDVPEETELVLNTDLRGMLSAEHVLNLLSMDFLIDQNLTYRTLKENVNLAKAGVHSAAWAYGPTVAVSHQYNKQHYFADGGMRMTPPNLVAVSVQMPLWSSAKRAAAITEKKIALESARNTLGETTDNLRIQYEQLRMVLQNAYESYLTLSDNLTVTERVFASTTNKYNYGAASNLELTNASNDVISAQSNYVQAVLSLIQAENDLETFLNY